MKNFFILLAGICLCSCSSMYYQVYSVKPYDDKVDPNTLFYEDENCVIHYDFWGEYGDAGFLVYNKSDKLISINLKESYFVLNGLAHDYYRNRTFVQSNTQSYTSVNTQADQVGAQATLHDKKYSLSGTYTASVGVSSANGQSYAVKSETNIGVNIKEQDIVSIPPKTAKVFREYNIVNGVYADCGLKSSPIFNEPIQHLYYTKEDSPIKFKNIITYIIDEKPVVVTNSFYIADIFNTHELDFVKTEYATDCSGKKSNMAKNYFYKYLLPYNFYIKTNTVVYK